MDLTLGARILHVLSALVLAGIPIIFWLSGHRGIADDARETTTAPLRRWIGIASLLSIVSGVYMLMIVMKDVGDVPGWHMVLGIKLLAALFLMFLGSAIVGRSPAFAKYRTAGGYTFSGILSIVVISLALWLAHGR